MPIRYLAVDLGASGGRHVLGWLERDKIRTEEIHRFESAFSEKGGRICRDLDHLYLEIMTGLKRCAELRRPPDYIGLDAWGADFVLLDRDGRRLAESGAGCARPAEEGAGRELRRAVGERELYRRSGVRNFSDSIRQLYTLKLSEPEKLEAAESFLMIPDYFNFRLTGRKANEYTSAAATRLVNAETRDWDRELMDRLGLPSRIFGPIRTPETLLGPLRGAVAAEVGFSARVLLPAAHEAASAVVAVPAGDEDYIYINSGPCSMMGIEVLIPNRTDESRMHNFINEGGYRCRYRYLKNIMGLRMIRSIRREFKHRYSFSDIIALAGLGSYFESLVDVNDRSFLAPPRMITAIQNYYRTRDLDIPETETEILSCAYKSLARDYAETAGEIEAVTGRDFGSIHIVGDGCRDEHLNRLTAEYTGKKILAGPAEAAAIGNLMAQMLATGELPDLPQARQAVRRSFPITEFQEGLLWN